MFGLMKSKNKLRYITVLLAVGLSGCWAPRCPVDTCLVEFEHVHASHISGVFSGKNPLHPPKVHFLWDKNKGEVNPNMDLKTVPGRKKLRKKFPWERW